MKEKVKCSITSRLLESYLTKPMAMQTSHIFKSSLTVLANVPAN